MPGQLPSPLFRTPRSFLAFPDLVCGESTRHGGVSPAPFNSLNLGGSTQDLQENVLENNRRFFSAMDISLNNVAKSHQIHEDKILNVVAAGRYEGYDALITNITDIQLAVTMADCTPILVFDPVKRGVAAIHAGWRGTVLEIALKTIKKMQLEFGSKPADCLGYIGTCIDACSFEVGKEVAENFSDKRKRWDNDLGKFFVDLKSANKDQLLAAGISENNIEISPYSTVLNNDDYFSYRLEKGHTGRMLATIGLRASGSINGR